jgi:hypothetical protein
MLYLEREVARRNRPNNIRVQITLFLRDREQLLVYLRLQNARFIFGHFKEDIVRAVMKLRYVSERPRAPRFVQRKRGYTDHGTLRPETQWREKYDWSFTEEQLMIERADALSDIMANTDWYLPLLDGDSDAVGEDPLSAPSEKDLRSNSF